MKGEMSSFNETNSSACSLHTARSSPAPLHAAEVPRKASICRCLFNARLPLPQVVPGVFWIPFSKDPVGFFQSTPPRATYFNTASRTCSSQHCLWRAASLNTSAHGAWGKNLCTLPSRWSIALLLRMRLKCSPRHLSSVSTFKCHASVKSRHPIFRKFSKYLRSAKSCVNQAQQCVGVHNPTRVPDIPIGWSW